MRLKKTTKCCICGKTLPIDISNNGYPFIGEVCEDCNKFAIMARLALCQNLLLKFENNSLSVEPYNKTAMKKFLYYYKIVDIPGYDNYKCLVEKSSSTVNTLWNKFVMSKLLKNLYGTVILVRKEFIDKTMEELKNE